MLKTINEVTLKYDKINILLNTIKYKYFKKIK